jgi:hypothetical protein
VLHEQPSLTSNLIRLYPKRLNLIIQINIQHPGKTIKYINRFLMFVRDGKREFITSSACTNEHRIFGPVNTGSSLTDAQPIEFTAGEIAHENGLMFVPAESPQSLFTGIADLK